MENKVLSNLFGIAGTLIWSVQLLPQIKLNYKLQSTKGLSVLCFISWYICGVILGTYLSFSKSTPTLIIQIICFTIFSGIIVLQYLYYERLMTMEKIGMILVACLISTILLAFGIYDILVTFKSNEFTLSLICTVLAAVFMLLGFLPQIYQIYKVKSAKGLSKIFVVLDLMGGVFSIFSLIFHVPFDFLAFGTYMVVPIFQSIIFFMVIYYEKYYPTSEIQEIPPLPNKKSFTNQIDHEMITMLSNQTDIFSKKDVSPKLGFSSDKTVNKSGFLFQQQIEQIQELQEKENNYLHNKKGEKDKLITSSNGLSTSTMIEIQIISPDNQIEIINESNSTNTDSKANNDLGAILV